eukprot:scaffold584897_cov34-Prasinocladus_malaysianus.AAC.1
MPDCLARPLLHPSHLAMGSHGSLNVCQQANLARLEHVSVRLGGQVANGPAGLLRQNRTP